uniref:Uncharacterized protein n=1 Tax=Picea glauca TaxID=3330 RepID=A0A117NHW1_PICGL|nr:hypothetical protein ABT39_MTgene4319 [Picea glauca]
MKRSNQHLLNYHSILPTHTIESTRRWVHRELSPGLTLSPSTLTATLHPTPTIASNRTSNLSLANTIASTLTATFPSTPINASSRTSNLTYYCASIASTRRWVHQDVFRTAIYPIIFLSLTTTHTL